MSDWIPTTCMRCAVGCGLVQQGVDAGYGLETVRGDGTHPVNQGLACRRGVSETATPEGEWLTRPMVRRESELVPTTWDVALARVVKAFDRRLSHDCDAVAVLGSGQQTNEAAYALGKLARGGLGTRYYDANTTLCMASAVAAYYAAFGSDAPPPTYDDVPEADRHIVWGANPAVAHPVLFRRITDSADDGDSAMLVIDPVRTETATAADVHVRPAPGGDLALARAVLAHVVATDRVDERFVRDATTGFEALQADLPDAAAAAERAGVDFDAVEVLADALDRSALVYWGMGVNQSVRGTDTAGALVDCCLATGNLRPGSGPFSLTGQANSMGTRVCSSKGTWPGHREFGDSGARAAVADAWGVPVGQLPDESGPGPVGIVEALEGGPVDAVYAVATNPVAGLPDASAAAERLNDAFLVAQDAFRTETTDLADVVLPAATWGESNGTTINMDRTVSRVRPATETPPGVRTDIDVITRLGDRLAGDLFADAATPASVFTELTALTAGTPADLSGISYDRLDAEQAVRWPAPDASTEGGYRYYEGGEWSFPTPSGQARFAGGEGQPLPEPPDEAYPLTLTTGREADGYNTGVRSRESPAQPGTLVARLHPDTVDAYREELVGDDAGDTDGAGDTGGSTDHDGTGGPDDADETGRLYAHIASRRATVAARVKPDDGVPREVVWLPVHHPATNDLTVPATDPKSDEPNYKQCAVRLIDPPGDATGDGRGATWD